MNRPTVLNKKTLEEQNLNFKQNVVKEKIQIPIEFIFRSSDIRYVIQVRPRKLYVIRKP